MLLDCFEANWEYANYLVPVLLGTSSTRLCNNLCELLGPTGGSSANNLSGSQEGQGLQSSPGLDGPARCATPPPPRSPPARFPSPPRKLPPGPIAVRSRSHPLAPLPIRTPGSRGSGRNGDEGVLSMLLSSSALAARPSS